MIVKYLNQHGASQHIKLRSAAPLNTHMIVADEVNNLRCDDDAAAAAAAAAAVTAAVAYSSC